MFPFVIVDVTKTSFATVGHEPLPSQLLKFEHFVACEAKLSRQVPEPSQESAELQVVTVMSPQGVFTATKPLSVQAPWPSHMSWLVHEVPASPHVVAADAWLGWQVPAPSHVSGALHS